MYVYDIMINSWDILKQENIKYTVVNKNEKKIKLINKNGKEHEIILKNSGFIERLNNYNFNKKEQYKLFLKSNIKHPESVFIDKNSNIKDLNLSYPLITKPINGGRGYKIYSIQNKNMLLQKSKQYSNNFIVQEKLEGDEYRIVVYKDTIISVCKKYDTILVGDGVNNIQTLVNNYNKFNKKMGYYGIKKYIYQDYSATKVRPKGEIINLSKNIKSPCHGNRLLTVDINDIHKDNQKLFIDGVKSIGYIYGGIDFIIPDISKSYKEQKCGILEINANPAIGILDVADKLSDYKYCKNKYNKIFFDIITLWHNDI